MHEKEKLKEANFFYERMKESVNNSVNNSEAFIYYLSAFLVAGRSVLYYIQKEVEGTKNKAWHDEKTNKNKNILFAFLKDQRDFTIHHFPVKPTQQMNLFLPPLEAIVGTVSVSLEVFDKDGNPISQYKSVNNKPQEEQKSKAKLKIEHEYIFPDFPGEDKNVLRLCEQYIDELDKFVEEGIKKGYITG